MSLQGALAKDVNLGLKELQEVPRARSCWCGQGCCTAVMGFHSVKFKAVGRGQREKGNLPHVFFKPFCKRFSFEMGPHQQHSLSSCIPG